MHYDWQLVHEPITWQEAIQAILDNKVVVCENCKGCIDYKFCGVAKEQKFTNNTPCWGQIATGTWYIDK